MCYCNTNWMKCIDTHMEDSGESWHVKMYGGILTWSVIHVEDDDMK